MTSFGLQLFVMRTERGLSIHELSRRSGVPANVISDAESDKSGISAGQIRSLADAMKADSDELFVCTNLPEVFGSCIPSHAIPMLNEDLEPWPAPKGSTRGRIIEFPRARKQAISARLVQFPSIDDLPTPRSLATEEAMERVLQALTNAPDASVLLPFWEEHCKREDAYLTVTEFGTMKEGSICEVVRIMMRIEEEEREH